MDAASLSGKAVGQPSQTRGRRRQGDRPRPLCRRRRAAGHDLRPLPAQPLSQRAHRLDRRAAGQGAARRPRRADRRRCSRYPLWPHVQGYPGPRQGRGAVRRRESGGGRGRYRRDRGGRARAHRCRVRGAAGGLQRRGGDAADRARHPSGNGGGPARRGGRQLTASSACIRRFPT